MGNQRNPPTAGKGGGRTNSNNAADGQWHKVPSKWKANKGQGKGAKGAPATKGASNQQLPTGPELDAAIAGIMVATPGDAILHEIYESPPDLEDKKAVEEYRARHTTRLRALMFKIHGATKIGHDWSADADEVATLKRMLSSLVPLHTQIARVQKALDNANMQMQQLETQEAAIQAKREDLEWKIENYKKSMAELGDGWFGQQYYDGEEDTAVDAMADDEGEQEQKEPIKAPSPPPPPLPPTVTMGPNGTTSIATRAKGKSPSAPPPKATAAASSIGGATRPPSQITAEDVTEIVQRATSEAHEKMLAAVAQAVQQAMATAMNAAAPASVAPGVPPPALEVPSRSPTRAPSRSLSVARRERYSEPYSVQGGSFDKQRRLAKYGGKYQGEWKAGESSDDGHASAENFSRGGAAK